MILLLVLIYLTGADDQKIEINPEQVVTVRAPRDHEHFGPSVNCLIHTTDGKYVTVKETCEIVRQKLAK